MTSIKSKLDTGTRMQLSFKSVATLADLNPGEEGILDRLELPEDVARRMMELGFLPGHVIVRGLSAPGGDPRVFRVDGSEIALRGETAAKLILRAPGAAPRPDAPCADPDDCGECPR